MAKPERQLSNKDIDKALGEVKFTKESEAKQFSHLTEQNWFRQYGKGSNAALKKITARVKKGIKHGKYGTSGMDTLDNSWKRFMKPIPQKRKKENKDLQKIQEKVIKKDQNTLPKTHKKKTVVSPSGKERTYNPASRTKKEYTKEVKSSALDFKLPDF